MAKTHEIETDGLRAWIKESEFMYASSSRERKRLYVNATGMIFVKVNEKTVWSGTELPLAVDAYNGIVEEFDSKISENP